MSHYRNVTILCIITLTFIDLQLWQCGGKMVDAPCSRVGHIYRKFAPFPNPGIGDFVGKVNVTLNFS